MATPLVIEVPLRTLAGLFEEAGPVRSAQQALHPQVFDAISEQAARSVRQQPIQVTLRVPGPELAASHEAGAAIEKYGAAMREYFAFRREGERKTLRQILRNGRQALVIGLGVLIIATAIGELIQESFKGRLMTGLASGLEIFGWVALWYPGELLLYEWIPVLRRLRTMDQLASAEIAVKPA